MTPTLPGGNVALWHPTRVERRIVLAVGLVAAVAVRVAAPSASHHFRFSAALACGSERWLGKTLQDRPTLLRARSATVAQLTALPRPSPFPTARTRFERRVYTVSAAVALVRQEADQDLHLVLKADGQQMIAEAPNASVCAPNASPRRRAQMLRARAAAGVCAQARVSGVAFWDFKHGQMGVAPNAIELHPILAFACLG